MLFDLGKGNPLLVAALGHGSKIDDVFHEFLVFPHRDDNGDLLACRFGDELRGHGRWEIVDGRSEIVDGECFAQFIRNFILLPVG
jgi:hypothetical protein